MALYEHTVMSRQDISAQQAEALNETIKGLIEQGGGAVAKIEYWGLRNLSYPINKQRKGHYTLLNIDGPAEAIAELERRQRISDDTIRYMTVKVDKLDDEPSPMMGRKGRKD